MRSRIFATLFCGFCLVFSPFSFFGEDVVPSARADEGTDSYWVSPTGSAPWTSCASAADPGSNYCSLATANANAAAGDTVYLKGGTYNYTSPYAEALAPKNSGAAGPPIVWLTFKNAFGETPEIQGTAGVRQWGLTIGRGGSYIRIDGIKFRYLSDMALIRDGAHHIEVSNCVFEDGGTFGMVEACLGGQPYTCYVSHLWIHHNTFSRLAAGGGCAGGSISEGGDAVRIGYPPGTCGTGGVGCTTGANHHITIEDNVLGGAGHALLDTYGTQLVIRNNVFHNEPWYPENNQGCTANWPASGYTNSAYNGRYGHRNWQMTDAFARDGTWNLAEGNRSGHASINPNNDGADNFDLASSKNIVRYNYFYNAMNNGLMFKYGPTGHGAVGGLYNRVYNNTIYRNGYGYPYYHSCSHSTCPEPQAGIRYYYQTQNVGNVIKNNIVLDSASYGYWGWDIQGSTGNTVIHNWLTSDGDPRFTDPDLTQAASTTLPDLSLRPNSGALDQGAYLTQANGSGSNSTVLAVDDAQYFQDGTWGSSLSNIQPDWIAIGNVNTVVQIASVNYALNTISLASPATWSDRANIWLYKKSDGGVVFAGLAPDMGAYEHPSPPADTTPPTVPTGLRAIAFSTSQVNLSWSASSDNRMVAGYKVFRNGTPIVQVASATAYQDTGLAAGAAYSYKVTAYDSAGNESAPSASVSAHTTSGGQLFLGLLGYWTFDSADTLGTTAYDRSGKGNNATLYPTASPPLLLVGKVGEALNFNAAAVNSVDLPTKMIGADTVTVCAWINPASTSFAAIVGNLDFLLVKNTSGVIQLSSEGGLSDARYAVSATGAYSVHQWTHLCAVRLSDGAAAIYINGAVSGAVGQNSGIPRAASYRETIGKRAAGLVNWPFDGMIDEVRIYDRALSAAEVAALYKYAGVPDTAMPAAPTGLRVQD